VDQLADKLAGKIANLTILDYFLLHKRYPLSTVSTTPEDMKRESSIYVLISNDCSCKQGNDYSCNPIIHSATDCNSLKARDENFEHVV